MIANGSKIREQILSLLSRKDYRPLNKVEIAGKIGVSGRARVALRKTLRDLERAGEIARIRKDRYVLPAEADLVTGKLSVHPVGFAFLTSEKPGEPDVFVAAENVGTGMHGDRVVARISLEPPAGRIKGRREGRVIRILERAHDTIVGTLQRSRNFYYVVPDDPRFVHDVYVRPVAAVREDRRSETAATVGDKVVVRLEDWQSRHVNPEGEIIEVLGPASAPGVDVLSVIGSIICRRNFRQTCWSRRSVFRKVLMRSKSRDAKICATNSSSPSIPTTRAISMTLFTWRSLQMAVG